PFNPSTTIKYTLPEKVFVKINVYNLQGEEVRVLVEESKEPGTYLFNFNAHGLASGLYIYKIKAGNFSMIKKMVLLK
ncbi:MAG: T9SS type A sorting domain-containing protein, partial [Ignavibacteriaceae bacterium]|nr:T9SS type A sorting domain-containing protein [Ignavibacteriaceae bacterium]